MFIIHLKGIKAIVNQMKKMQKVAILSRQLSSLST